jgi:predicted Fe-S protein YdhL (DUF1289 family)|tara:strand:+ start:423 stop:560 length:138 start_codon:yes stop_codon:yes gene_type:complete
MVDRKTLTPCIGICKLKDNICIGCKRTIEEIKEAYDKLVAKNNKM